MGDIGVGGGALGKSLPYCRGEISLSVSDDKSSSQESAMVEACCLGTALRGLWEEVERERPLREDSTSVDISTRVGVLLRMSFDRTLPSSIGYAHGEEVRGMRRKEGIKLV